ncbi:MAG: chemotaxis protein CheD [bacterium]|nr:chemotaxis protein CheD [bacterium]
MERALVTKEYFLRPGYLYLTQEPNIIYTVLGSCVMVCLWDRQNGTTGTCHFKYPYTSDRNQSTPEYGNVALSSLISMMMRSGSSRFSLEAMIFGGADREEKGNTGEMNVKIAHRILKEKKIKVVSEDTKGLLGRKIMYHTETNQAVIYKIRKLRDMDWYPYSNV